MKLMSRMSAAAMVVSMLAGCGSAPSATIGANSAKSFKMASKSVIAAFPHGLGWKKQGTAALYNDTRTLQALDVRAPKKADLRPLASPVADQGQFGSCTAFSMVKGLKEFMELKGIRDRNGDPTKEFTPLSPAYLWFWERSYTGASYIDQGANIFLGMNLMQGSGIPSEAAYPYPTPTQQRDPWFCKFFLPSTPSAAVAASAVPSKGGALRQINKLSELKASLDDGYPVVFGFMVFESIERVGADGMLPVPNLQDEQCLGGHAICAMGYDDAKQVIIIKNSWGPDWGDQGYFYMPYKYFDMDLGLVADGWSMRE